LPAIQREFVWRPEQIIELFDSIMRQYPISSFLFWDLKPETRADWDIYKFVEHASEGGSHNEITGTEGISDLTLVLDGQQRLTSRPDSELLSNAIPQIDFQVFGIVSGRRLGYAAASA
jgi:uncharacterized protein with ParB-like and HNH nuclease domain